MSTAAPPLGVAVRGAIERLRAAGSPTPRLDAEVLVAHVTGRDRAWVLAHPEAALDHDARSALSEAVERRSAGEPIAYIRGFKEWHSLRIRTDPRALIPRPETELLAEAAKAGIEARLARTNEPVVAWEVATGSGAVAVLLALRFRQAIGEGRLRLIASDISPDALELAAENLAEHGVAPLVTMALTDLLETAGGLLPRPDVVIANLPYVASAEVDARQGSLGFEPRIALDGGPDGLDLLRLLFADLPARVRLAGTALLEIGVAQVDAIRALAPSGASVTVVPDFAGLERVVRVDLP
jgi:release factor glutamine methyltransferase